MTKEQLVLFRMISAVSKAQVKFWSFLHEGDKFMPLRDQADLYLGNQGGTNLVNAGPACEGIARSIQQNDAVASSLLATIFWQSFINSSAFRIVLSSFAKDLRGDPSLLRAVLQRSPRVQLDTLIVRHGKGNWPRQDLLFFVHGADQRQTPIGIKNIKDIMQKENIPSYVLIGGWRLFAATQRGLEQVIMRQGGDAALEILEAQSFHILVAPRPLVEYTAAFASSPGLAVIPKSGSQMTVGLYVDCHDGRRGITTSLHAIDQYSSKYVEILNHSFQVLDADKSPITDSCFIEIPPHTNLQQYFLRPLGPLVGVAPAVGAIMSFERVNQGMQLATITAVDIGIPWFTRSPNQVKVYTDPVTVPGDSGAALVDDKTNTVVGFCFWRFVGPFSAGAWIWAESVFIAHHLIY